MTLQKLFSAALVPALLFCAACDGEGMGKAGGGLSPEELMQQAELERIANEDLDLEGEACDPAMVQELVSSDGYRLCAGGAGVQGCHGPSYADAAFWSSCQQGADCIPGETQKPFADSGLMGCEEITISCYEVQGIPFWEEAECSTPLVLRFDDAPVRYHAFDGSQPTAAFAPGGSCTTTDWPTASTPWLVLDRDGNGRIEGGEELFGSSTVLNSGGTAEHGFQALAELDANHDGRIDAQDPDFSRLALWADHDADRRSTSTELTPLAESGVHALSVDYGVEVECDERGNCGKERAAFEFEGGLQSRTGEIVDVYLPCR